MTGWHAFTHDIQWHCFLPRPIQFAMQFSATAARAPAQLQGQKISKDPTWQQWPKPTIIISTTMQRRHRSRLLAQSPRFAALSGARQLPAGSSRGCRASYLRGPLTTQNFTIHHYLATISLFLQDMCTVYYQHSRVTLPTHASQWST